MTGRGRRTVLGGVLLAAGILLGGRVRADTALCQATIARETAKHADAVMRGVQRCEALVLAGALPATTDCLADPGTPAALALAARARGRIARQCCGADRACSTPDDVTVAAIGWGAGVCPDFESGACTNQTADPDGVAACTTCVAAVAVDLLREIAYDRLGTASPGSALARCQLTIGKASARFVEQRSKLLAKCWVGRALGAHQNACPDPGDGRAGPGIARAATALSASICKACGGSDGRCGGGDDLLPSAIGFLAACPALAVPGGGSCGGPIQGLADLVACLRCVAGFAVDCADALAVPAFTAYPAECNPPPGTCAPGVTCETSLDCPADYACRDNGGGVRYCLGPECAVDQDCGGGAACRQYCTLAGCGPRRCQCPGFGCTGPDELCIRDGDVACRKICTQDSDCTDPFGLVCVNPGFGFGLCIGAVSCQ